MKYIKTYEDFENKWFAFEDSNLRVHKIKNGENKDKIMFATPYKNEDGVETWSKHSLMLGCARLLDTKYENNPKIREVEIGGMKFREIKIGTLSAISRLFLMQMGYSKEKVNTIIVSFSLISLDPIADNLKSLIETAKNLGEVIDGLRIIRDEFFDFHREEYEAWRLNTDIKKYNL